MPIEQTLAIRFRIWGEPVRRHSSPVLLAERLGALAADRTAKKASRKLHQVNTAGRLPDVTLLSRCISHDMQVAHLLE